MKLIRIGKIAFILCVIFYHTYARGAVRARVSKTIVEAGEEFQLNIQADNLNAQADLSNLKDFDIISRSSSTQVQIINGKMQTTIELTYSLIPLKTGTLIIPPIPVTVKGKIFYTNPVKIKVVQKKRSSTSPLVFMQSEIKPVEGYIGQVFLYKLKLFSRTKLRNAGLREMDTEGFMPDPIAKKEPVQRTGREYVYGQSYDVIEVIYPLYSLKTGDLMIKGGSISVEYFLPEKKSRTNPLWDFFEDDFFSGRSYRRKVFTSQPIKVRVKPLPEKPGKERFAGLVGAFSSQWEISRKRIKENETLTLTLKIRGKGNLRNFSFPENFHIPGFKTFIDKPHIEVRMGRETLEGEGVVKIALVPQKSGNFRIKIPVKSMPTYFDPSKEQYVSFSAPEFEVIVLPSKGIKKSTFVSSSPGLEKGKKVLNLTTDIFGIYTSSKALHSQRILPSPMIVLFLTFSFPLILTGILLYRRFSAKYAQMEKEIISSRAFGFLKKEIKDAKNSKDIVRVFLKFISRRAQAPEGITPSEASQLVRNILDEKTHRELTDTISKLEASAYGGAQIQADEVKDKIMKIAKVIDRRWRR